MCRNLDSEVGVESIFENPFINGNFKTLEQ